MSEHNPGYTNCIECDKAIPEKAARRCPVCNQRPLCGRCSAAHSENCRKPPGYTCKLCDESFAVLADFTNHVVACRRPSEIPDDVSFHCPKCGLSFVSSSEVIRHTQSCQGVPPVPTQRTVALEAKELLDKVAFDPRLNDLIGSDSDYMRLNQRTHEDLNKRLEKLEVRVEPDAAVQNIHARSISALERKAEEPEVDSHSRQAGAQCFGCGSTLVGAEDGGWTCLKCSRPKSPKPSGNHGTLDIQSWFQLRVPTEQEAKDMDTLRATYTDLALDLEILCPEGADRMAALRLLKQSMHTAIGSILTMDAWQTPKSE